MNCDPLSIISPKISGSSHIRIALNFVHIHKENGDSRQKTGWDLDCIYELPQHWSRQISFNSVQLYLCTNNTGGCYQIIFSSSPLLGVGCIQLVFNKLVQCLMCPGYQAAGKMVIYCQTKVFAKWLLGRPDSDQLKIFLKRHNYQIKRLCQGTETDSVSNKKQAGGSGLWLFKTKKVHKVK